MPSATDPNPSIAADQVRQQLVGKHVCPFCGVVRADPQQPCPRCTMEDTSSTRAATRQRIGPWFVLQARNPSAPGMKFATLLSLVKKGHVTPRSIVRGPTTHQLWTFAARVRGMSREYGLCWHCGESITVIATHCQHCDRPQEAPSDPDTLLEAAAGPPEPAVVAPPPLSSEPLNSDTGMDGGTSLDLQLDPATEEGHFASPVDRSADRPAGRTTGRASGRPATPTSRQPPNASQPGAGSIAGSAPAHPPVNPPLIAVDPFDSPDEPLALTPRTSPAPLPALRPRNAAPMTPARAGAAKEESILTARELAAAFQLDFKPPAGTRASKPLGAGKIFFVLLLTLLAAAAVVLYLRPDWREQTRTWAQTTWTTIRSSLEQPAARGPQSDTPTAPLATPSRSPLPEPRATPPVAKAPDPQATPTPAPVAPTPAPAPPTIVERPPAAPTPVATPVPPPPVPPVAERQPPRPQPPANPPPADPTPGDAVARAQQLRSAAIDAEGTDWPTARRLYEEIERLPRDAWPADLQVRLNRARERAR